MSELKYSRDHEWLRVEADGTVTIGITDYAQKELGDVVYVELPEVGREVRQDEDAAVVESVKAASEVKMPVAGSVVAVNEALADHPETVNSDPTGEGWFLTAEMIELIHGGAANIVCMQPFACLPNHITGKGMIKELKRRFPASNIVTVDYDPGASEVNKLNRIKLMLSTAFKNLDKPDKKEA